MDLLDTIVDFIEHSGGVGPRQRHQWPDRRGEFWCLCPMHLDREVGSFSFSERGFRCFSCSARGSLRRLADHLGIAGEPAPLATRPRRSVRRASPLAPVRPWQTDPWLLERFQPIPDLGLRYAHARGLSDATIERWRIGWGTLPASRARLPRLILPVIEGDQVVGLRGRAVHPDDAEPKWLQAAGSKTTLFNLDGLARAGNRTLFITEAPLACTLVEQEHPDVVAVASTAGCATWRDEWTEAVRSSQPAAVLVWMDNDPAGRAASAKVGNALARARVPVHVYTWPRGAPEKQDLADLALAEIRARIYLRRTCRVGDRARSPRPPPPPRGGGAEGLVSPAGAGVARRRASVSTALGSAPSSA